MEIQALLQSARVASRKIAQTSDFRKRDLLLLLADLLELRKDEILVENARDISAMDREDPKIDRLLLTEKRVQDIADSVRQVAYLPDPTGQLLLKREIREGLFLEKKTVPLGVVGVIYESRPNVTIEVAALCLRSGNACVLKGGKEAEHSNRMLIAILHEALASLGLEEAVVLLPSNREAVNDLLKAERWVDILIPRGSDTLIQFVRKNSSIPVIETGAGVCHVYIDGEADLEKALEIVVNAKVSRPAVCNALDTILIAEAIAIPFLKMLAGGFAKHQIEVFADERANEVLQGVHYEPLHLAAEEDFGREFLSLKCSIAIVSGLDQALAHIEAYSSRHSEAIITENAERAERFLAEVDAAAVYWNASTRFTDGGEFGLGAEIGISTQKLHARGPFALEKLVTEKWICRGDGHVRV